MRPPKTFQNSRVLDPSSTLGGYGGSRERLLTLASPSIGQETLAYRLTSQGFGEVTRFVLEVDLLDNLALVRAAESPRIHLQGHAAFALLVPRRWLLHTANLWSVVPFPPFRTASRAA